MQFVSLLFAGVVVRESEEESENNVEDDDDSSNVEDYNNWPAEKSWRVFSVISWPANNGHIPRINHIYRHLFRPSFFRQLKFHNF